MSEEPHGLFHFGKKDELPEMSQEASPPPKEHHGLFHLGKKEEPPPPPPPEKHGLFHFGKEAPPPPPPPPAGLMARLFHRAPVTPEPASPQRPQLFRHHSFRSALYILGLLLLLAGIANVLPGYRFATLAIGAALLLGGVLLTGDWHPLSGMLGLRRVRIPTSTTGVAAVVAEHEAREIINKVTREDGEDAKARESVAQRLAPWHWPWSARAREAAQEQKAGEAKKFKHVGIGGKILMGIMAAVMGHGANMIIQALHPPAGLSAFPAYAHWAIILVTIALILFIVTTRIRTFRHHWLSPFAILRRLLIFFIVAAVVAVLAGLLTQSSALGQGYGELIGGLVGWLAVLI